MTKLYLTYLYMETLLTIAELGVKPQKAKVLDANRRETAND